MNLREIGAARRRVTRVALGRPGSLRRWFVLTVLASMVAALIWSRTGNVVAFFVVALFSIYFLFWRGLLTGDEDDVGAAIVYDVVDSLLKRDGSSDASDEPDDDGWPARPAQDAVDDPGRFFEAPAAPVADDGESEHDVRTDKKGVPR